MPPRFDLGKFVLGRDRDRGSGNAGAQAEPATDDTPFFSLEGTAPGAQFFRRSDACAGVMVWGATGSGKTSGPGTAWAKAYLRQRMGGLVLCAKTEERAQWEKWAAATGRTDDLVIIDASGKHGYNFLDAEASRPGRAGFSVNIVALLDEIAGAIEAGGEGESGGDAAFFRQQLRHLLTNLVDLPLLAGLPVSLPLLRLIASSAPLSLAQMDDPRWQAESACWRILQEGEQATQADPARQADFAECKTYWTSDFPSFSDRSRSIVLSMLGVLLRPFVTSPLRQLFSEQTTVRPEDTFDGKILIIDLPVQEYRQIGRIAALAWKWCFQVAVMRRSHSPDNRLVFLWADEAQNFVTQRDAEYQAVARSAGGCTVYLTQSREGLRRALRSDDATEALLGNLQTKIFGQCTGQTASYGAALLGERYTNIKSRSINIARQHGPTATPNDATGQAGMTRSEHEELRRFVEAAEFTTLKRGGPPDFHVEAIAYCGGKRFTATGPEPLPFVLLNFRQEPR